MRLATREIAQVLFRHELPGYLAKEAPAWIEIDARAGGLVNAEFMAGMDALNMQAAIMDKQAGAFEKLAYEAKDAKTRDDLLRQMGERQHANNLSIVRARYGMIYDTCILAWRTNVLSDGKPIECNRDNFLELLEVRGVPELKMALTLFETEVLNAGKVVYEQDTDTVKN